MLLALTHLSPIPKIRSTPSRRVLPLESPVPVASVGDVFVPLVGDGFDPVPDFGVVEALGTFFPLLDHSAHCEPAVAQASATGQGQDSQTPA